MISIYNPVNGFEAETWGLIDTGADSSVIPESLARELYHDIRNHQVEKNINFGLGGPVEVFMHSFNIDVLATGKTGKITTRKAFKIKDTKIAVVPNLHMVILGVSDFLKDLILNIDYPNHIFSLTTK